MIDGDVRVTFANPSVYETLGRDSYLAGAVRDSDSRIERRRAGAGLDDAQIARIAHLGPRVPHQLESLAKGEFRILSGVLGTGKSDMAEAWFRDAVKAAQTSPGAAVPLWIAIDDLESSLQLHVQREIGLQALETVGADIVIDGLDQRADRAERTVGYADSLTRRWARTRVVLTSRATHNALERFVVRAEPMSRSYGRNLVEMVSGSQLGTLRPEIEEALERPLFALLIGQRASLSELTTMTEVIEGVVRQVVGREGGDLYPHLRRLAIQTTETARPVDPESFVDFDVAARLRESPFLTATANGLSFSLATFEQWFASRAVLEEAVTVDDILEGLPSFDRWKYVFSMVLAAGEPSRVDPAMERIARWNPGAIAWIINDTESAELGRYRNESSTEPSQQQMAHRLRLALGAMLDGLGPLAAAFSPFSFPGVRSLQDLSLGLEYGGGLVRTTWLVSNQLPDNPLPPVIDASVHFSTNRSLVIETAEMPAARNWVWTTARNILASDLSERLTTVAIQLASQRDGIVRREVEDLRRRRAVQPQSLDELGRGLYGGIYPLPDVPPGPTGWPGFSLESVAERVRAVITAAIKCYVEICDSVAPKFGDTLAHKGMMPFEYYANMSYNGPGSGGPFSLGPAEPGIRWLLRPVGTPLPNGERRGENSVNMTVNDDERSRQILDERQAFGDAYFEYIANVPGLRPFADSFSLSTGRFDIIDKKPATHIAVDWLWDDLKNLKWVSGLKPSDKTE
ncbi:hypothetical protein [Mycolicibacterium sp. J2]|uniref:hypothetical protein n=1 Tax=Mycolicibacterium sp. J2 TaxID=2993511 RepID=UPI00224A89EF|nr:hypothetical protein [Mycolicibacterium sp. J2]MCX2714520.1 hypothetical protein [Mycolicibacterium sp. J2]